MIITFDKVYYISLLFIVNSVFRVNLPTKDFGQYTIKSGGEI